MPHPPGAEMLRGAASGTGEGPQRGFPRGRARPGRAGHPSPTSPTPDSQRPPGCGDPARSRRHPGAAGRGGHRAEVRSAPRRAPLRSALPRSRLPPGGCWRPPPRRGCRSRPGCGGCGCLAGFPRSADPLLGRPLPLPGAGLADAGLAGPFPTPVSAFPSRAPPGRGGCPRRRSPPPARRRPAPARGCCPARSQQPPRLPPPRTSLAITGGGGCGPPSRPPRPGPPRRVCPAPSTIPGRRAGREGGRRRRGGEKGEAEGGGCPSRSRPPQVGSERPAAPGEPLREAESRGVSPSRTGGSLPPPSWSELPPPLGCSARLHASAAHPQPTAASPGFSRSPHPSRAGDGTARLDEAAGRGGGGGRLPLGQRSRTERPDGQTSREAPLLSRPLIPAAGESRGAVPALTDTCTLGGFLLRSLLQRKWRNPASPVPSFLPSASAFLAGSSILHRSPTSSLPQIPCTVSIPSSRLRPAHPGIIRCPASRTGVLHHLISACLLHVSLHSLPCEAHLI